MPTPVSIIVGIDDRRSSRRSGRVACVAAVDDDAGLGSRLARSAAGRPACGPGIGSATIDLMLEAATARHDAGDAAGFRAWAVFIVEHASGRRWEVYRK